MTAQPDTVAFRARSQHGGREFEPPAVHQNLRKEAARLARTIRSTKQTLSSSIAISPTTHTQVGNVTLCKNEPRRASHRSDGRRPLRDLHARSDRHIVEGIFVRALPVGGSGSIIPPVPDVAGDRLRGLRIAAAAWRVLRTPVAPRSARGLASPVARISFLVPRPFERPQIAALGIHFCR